MSWRCYRIIIPLMLLCGCTRMVKAYREDTIQKDTKPIIDAAIKASYNSEDFKKAFKTHFIQNIMEPQFIGPICTLAGLLLGNVKKRTSLNAGAKKADS